MHEATYNQIAVEQVRWWDEQPADGDHTVNSFAGEFQFSHHDLVPECLRDFLVESFPKKESFSKIPLDDINGLLNAVWQGPGSMARIMMYRTQLKETNRLGSPYSPVTEDTSVEEFVAARSASHEL